jgi:hypothetical protein
MWKILIWIFIADSRPWKVPDADNILRRNGKSNRKEIFILKRNYATVYSSSHTKL